MGVAAVIVSLQSSFSVKRFEATATDSGRGAVNILIWAQKRNESMMCRLDVEHGKEAILFVELLLSISFRLSMFLPVSL